MQPDDQQTPAGPAGNTGRAAAALLIGTFASRASHAGAGVAVVGGLTSTDLAAIGGLAVALIGTVIGQGINLYFRLREDRRAERESAARLRATLGSGADVPGGHS